MGGSICLFLEKKIRYKNFTKIEQLSREQTIVLVEIASVAGKFHR